MAFVSIQGLALPLSPVCDRSICRSIETGSLQNCETGHTKNAENPLFQGLMSDTRAKRKGCLVEAAFSLDTV
jgi:hypothetical protein